MPPIIPRDDMETGFLALTLAGTVGLVWTLGVLV
jgi:hypothetical protein